MDLKRLEVFEAIMRSGTVSAAAREMGLTQSAVSRILARFEEDLGYPLFRRVHGRLQPNARANSVLVQVRDVLEAMSGLRDMQSGRVEPRQDRIQFVTVPSVAHDLVPSVLRSFLAMRPGIKIGFDVRTTEATADAMMRRLADFAIITLPVSHPTLNVTPIYRSTSCCVLHRDHPLASKERILAQDLKGESLVFLLRRQPTRQLIEEAFERAGIAPNIRIETANVATACRCAAEGLGVAVVNALMAGYSASPDLVIRPFEPRIHHTLAFIEPAGKARPPEIADFIACLHADITAMAARRQIEIEHLDPGYSDPE